MARVAQLAPVDTADLSRLYTVEEAAGLFGVSRGWIYAGIRDGEIRHTDLARNSDPGSRRRKLRLWHRELLRVIRERTDGAPDTDDEESPQLYTVEQAAAQLGVSPGWVRLRIDAGEIHPTDLSRGDEGRPKHRIWRAELLRFIAANTATP